MLVASVPAGHGAELRLDWDAGAWSLRRFVVNVFAPYVPCVDVTLAARVVAALAGGEPVSTMTLPPAECNALLAAGVRVQPAAAGDPPHDAAAAIPFLPAVRVRVRGHPATAVVVRGGVVHIIPCVEQRVTSTPRPPVRRQWMRFADSDAAVRITARASHAIVDVVVGRPGLPVVTLAELVAELVSVRGRPCSIVVRRGAPVEAVRMIARALVAEGVIVDTDAHSRSAATRSRAESAAAVVDATAALPEITGAQLGTIVLLLRELISPATRAWLVCSGTAWMSAIDALRDASGVHFEAPAARLHGRDIRAALAEVPCARWSCVPGAYEAPWTVFRALAKRWGLASAAKSTARTVSGPDPPVFEWCAGSCALRVAVEPGSC
jgi:hypothetical protein